MHFATPCLNWKTTLPSISISFPQSKYVLKTSYAICSSFYFSGPLILFIHTRVCKALDFTDPNSYHNLDNDGDNFKRNLKMSFFVSFPWKHVKMLARMGRKSQWRFIETCSVKAIQYSTTLSEKIKPNVMTSFDTCQTFW